MFNYQKKLFFHIDMNNYFASIEENFNPQLRNVPFAVIGDPKMRHSIIMAKNALAKTAGVLTGISLAQGIAICPDLTYVIADMPKYLHITKEIRDIFAKYSQTVIPYGLDEAWLEINNHSREQAIELANIIRLDIKFGLGLTCSIGIANNLIWSKMGSDYLKPNAITYVDDDNFLSLFGDKPVTDMLFIGQKRGLLLNRFGLNTIYDLKKASKDDLIKILKKKVGSDIFNYLRGIDDNFNPKTNKIKSLGNTITPPKNITNFDNAMSLIYLISKAVSTRLKKHRLLAKSLCLIIKDEDFKVVQKRKSGFLPTNDLNDIFLVTSDILESFYNFDKSIRSIAIRADNLFYFPFVIQNFLPSEVNERLINDKIKTLVRQIGELKLENSVFLKD